MRILRVSLMSWLMLFSVAVAEDAPKRVSEQEALRAAVTKVQPQYPAMARQLRLSGTVRLEAFISEAGNVDQVRILAGNPVLTAPAGAALKRWKFTPFTSDGKPVKAIAPFEFNFHLAN